jgi:hypothetical protein
VTKTKDNCIQARLVVELQTLQHTLGIGDHLTVRYTPGGKPELSGEVRGTTIHVYDEDEEDAVNTLRHEVLDHYISKVIEPYRDVTNLLIQKINRDAYQRKEQVIEALLRLLE